MDQRRMMDQVSLVFGLFMTFFYLSVGIFVIVSLDLYYINKFMRNLMGFSFILFGIYRGFRTYQKVRELYFPGNNKNER